MKLNKEFVKKGLKNQLVSIGHMLVFNIISFILFWISYIGTKPTGNITGQIFGIREYKVNLFFVIFCLIMFIISFSIYYTMFFKKNLKKQLEIHWIFAVLFVIVGLIFCYVELILYLLATIFNIGIFSAVVNSPESIDVIVVVYVVGYIVVDLIREIINKKRKKQYKTIQEEA